MKCKRGFVTNSSSSSFIVAWDKRIDDYDLGYISDILENQKYAEVILEKSLSKETFDGKIKLPLYLKTEKSKKDLKNIFQNTGGSLIVNEVGYREELDMYWDKKSKPGMKYHDREEIKRIYEPEIDAGYEYPRFFHRMNDKEKYKVTNLDWKLFNTVRMAYRRIESENFFKNNKDKYVYVYFLSDNMTELESKMEHGLIFKRLSYVRFNQH